MPKYATEGRFEGLMAEFTGQFRDFVAHFNKGQGMITHLLQKHDERFEGVERRLNGIDERLNNIDDRFDSVHNKLDQMM